MEKMKILYFLHWVLSKIQQCAGVLSYRITFVTAADSLSVFVSRRLRVARAEPSRRREHRQIRDRSLAEPFALSGFKGGGGIPRETQRPNRCNYSRTAPEGGANMEPLAGIIAGRAGDVANQDTRYRSRDIRSALLSFTQYPVQKI